LGYGTGTLRPAEQLLVEHFDPDRLSPARLRAGADGDETIHLGSEIKGAPYYLRQESRGQLLRRVLRDRLVIGQSLLAHREDARPLSGSQVTISDS